jgi:hypothetical protein
MPTEFRSPSGRPLTGEFADYARPDIEAVPGDDAVAALEGLARETLSWTLKEIVGHLADDERVFAYRALCVARGDPRELPGFDEGLYVSGAEFETRRLADLLTEYRAVRQATIALLIGLPAKAWQRRGIVNGYTASVRGLAFHIVGHELHHLRVLREKYL